MYLRESKNVYIIGSKGIPAKYGGFETFVEKLTENQRNKNIIYHVACMTENSIKSGIAEKNFKYNGADCFNINVPNIGPARAIYYDIAALDYAIKLARKNKDKEPIFYILACRIGIFIKYFKNKIEEVNGLLYVNPDGHEWLRAKWSKPVRKYWKISEKLMVKHADLLICDSKTIEKYIHKSYKKYNPKTIYIAYGADCTPSVLSDRSEKFMRWMKSFNITLKNYYLVVGRFVPENNYETMIREFMLSKSDKDFVIITNVEGADFFDKLKNETHFEMDKRIKFVGTVYDQQLLKKIRENAFAYFHGHEVGGTNPSLIEALGSTQLNLLLDVGFNREVADKGALYWTKADGNLSNLINKVEFNEERYSNLERIAKKRISEKFTWKYIINEYEKTFK